MTTWRNYQIYYTHLDPLILDCVYPALLEVEKELTTCFWERHFLGGPHVRVRLFGDERAVRESGAWIEERALEFMASHPAEAVSNYSIDRARKMAELEEERFEEDDLVYRVNCVRQRPYQRIPNPLASEEAAGLLHSFLNDSMPLAIALMTSPSRLESALQLCFHEALFVCDGDIVRGSVSFKSHWESFVGYMQLDALRGKLQENYGNAQEQIRRILEETVASYQSGRFGNESSRRWQELLQTYSERIRRIIASGKHVTFQMSSPQQVLDKKRMIFEKAEGPSPFLDELYRDQRFLASFQYEPGLLEPRAIINLLYFVFATAGLNALDKMSLCYYVHRAVEDSYACDLTNVLKATVKEVVGRHGRRFEDQA